MPETEEKKTEERRGGENRPPREGRPGGGGGPQSGGPGGHRPGLDRHRSGRRAHGFSLPVGWAASPRPRAGADRPGRI